MDATENRVFDTLTGLADRAISVYAAKNQPRAAATASAPSGGGWTVWNPFPGTQGQYPQGESKGAPSISVGGVGFNPLLLIGGIVLLIVALLFRK